MKKTFTAGDIFKPGTFPIHTYISRKPDGLISYEKRLEEALETPGFLTSIVGPSKSGKTVLCERVIPEDRRQIFNGVDFRHHDNFWTAVAAKLNLPIETSKTDTSGDALQGSVNGSAGISAFVKGNVSAGGSYTSNTSESTTQKHLTHKDRVIHEFLSKNLVMVLDDFHYIDGEMQIQIAYELKDAIRQELKAVVISLPHRADDSIRENPDLNGRMNFINIDPWTIDELEQIPITGFEKLGVNISSSLSKRLATESITSPQLIQNLCLSLARMMDSSDADVSQLESKNVIESTFRIATLNMAYRDVLKVIEAGPYTRGQKRTTYTVNGENKDIYGVILAALAKDPPLVSMSMDELRKRIASIVGPKDIIARNKVSESLKQIQGIIRENGPLYHVLEWKDEEIYILDPYFLFYLRWTLHV